MRNPPFLSLLLPMLLNCAPFCSTAESSGLSDLGDRIKLLRASGLGHPWVFFEDGYALPDAGGIETPVLREDAAAGLALAQGDFDQDGVPDLAVASCWKGAGLIQVWRGNIATTHPNSSPALPQHQAGVENPAPFFPPEFSVELDLVPDFLAVGDMDADGIPDLVVTARGTESLLVLFGDGKGGFGSPDAVGLPGSVTAFAIADVGHADGLADILVATASDSASRLLIFTNPRGALQSAPKEIDMPGEGRRIAAGQLDDDYWIDIVVAGRESLGLFSRDPLTGTGFVEVAAYHPAQPGIAALATGDFLGDERQELAVLTESGDLEFVSFGEQGATLIQTASLAVQPLAESLAPSEAALRAITGSAGPDPSLIRGRVSMLPNDDLIVTIPGVPGIYVVMADTTTLSGESFPRPLSEAAAARPGVAMLAARSLPAAVLPMRLNRDGLHDLVFLPADEPVPGVSLSTGAAYMVTSTGDEPDGSPGDGKCAIQPCTGGVCTGPCTFRAALDEANRDKQPSTITFQLPAGSTITVANGTYTSNEPLTIDGGQDAGGKPVIEINGNGYLGRGIVLRGADSVVRGLVINRFKKAAGQTQGILITLETGANNCTIAGNYLGINQAGTESLDPRNLTRAAVIVASSQNTIGGTTSQDRNVIGGHDWGITVSGSGNKVQGNYLGVNLIGGQTVRLNLGTAAEMGATGVLVQNGTGNLIGGSAAARNVISGNLSSGVSLYGGSGNFVQSNYLGTTIDGKSGGTTGLGNVGAGINVEGSQGNQIGGAGALGNVVGTTGGIGDVSAVHIWPGWIGAAPSENVVDGNLLGTDREGKEALNSRVGVDIFNGARNQISGNLISGNGGNGITVRGFDATGNQIAGNRIGTQSDGSSPLPNQGHGIAVSDQASATLIEGNTIAFSSSGNGVTVLSGNGHQIQGNRIFGNALLGIDLAGDGVTANDALDQDSGPNQLQNFPVLEKVPGAANLWGTLHTLPSTAFRIELFANDACNSSGHGEGQALLDSFSVQTDTDGDAAFVTANVPVGKFFTATATDPDGNTSEFSACAATAGAAPFVVNSTGDAPDQDWDTGKPENQQSLDGVCSTGRKADGTPGPCNTQKAGDCECTLRAAIQEANYRAGRDRIHFDIAGSLPQSGTAARVIRPGSALPEVRGEVVIDGYTQAGSVEASATSPARLMIELDGTNAGVDKDGIVISGSNSEIRGLAIHSFHRHGVVIKGSGNQVAGNHLGVNPSGSQITQPPFSGSDIGIWIFNSADNRIGGSEARERNLIAGFTTGIQILGVGASGNQVLGNHFCYDPSARKLLTEQACFLYGIMVLEASNNQIGGAAPNVIGGAVNGITIQGGILARGNKVQGNLIGTDSYFPDLGRALGNWIGIDVDASETLIGGDQPDQGNAVANGPGFQVAYLRELRGGIQFHGKSQGNSIQGNQIHSFPDYGIRITGQASNNLIGGLTRDHGNAVARNGVGVLIDSDEAVGNRILSNRVYLNALNISLSKPVDNPSEIAGLQPLPNDRGDRDEGPNRRQNHPDMPSWATHGGVPVPYFTAGPQVALVRVTLDSLPDEEFDIQFFASSLPPTDTGGWRRCGAEIYLGKTTVSTNQVGTAYGFGRFPIDALQGMEWVTATATSSLGDTSELGTCAGQLSDSDGDGVPDWIEDRLPGRGDSNQNGIPDAQESDVTAIPYWSDSARGKSPVLPVETNAIGLVIESLISTGKVPSGYLGASVESAIELAWTRSRQDLGGGSGTTTIRVEHLSSDGFSPRVSSSILTYRLPEGLRVRSFYNYGPTPDDPSPHLYEFLFDGTTGAKILGDRIEVHFVDGGRGDHDLNVNGVIETLGGPVIDSTTFYFPQIGDGLAGDIQFQSSMVFANAGGISPVRIDLTDFAGAFMDLELDGLGSGSLFELGLLPGEALSTQTPGTGQLQVGYAEVIGAEGLGGTAIFSRSDARRGVLLYETGVPAARPLSEFSVFLDSLGNRDTGLALAYPQSQQEEQPDAAVTLRLYDRSFTLIGTRTLTLAPGQHLARFIRELFPNHAVRASEMEGVVTVAGDQALAAVTLRQNDDPRREFPEEVPTLTAFPVIPGRADGTSSAAWEERVFYFAQVADGAVPGIALKTSMIFVNTGPAAQLRVDLFDFTGAPMSLDLGVGPASSVYQFSLVRGQAISLQSPGTGSLQVGYAKVTAGGQVGGTAVFTLVHSSTAVLLYEAGVPAAEPLREFSLVADSRGHRRTGLALVAPPDQPGGAVARLRLRLYDREFNFIREKALDLAPGEHYARFVNEIFPEVAGVTEMLGSLTVSSDLPVAAVTLRETDDPSLGFPDDVPVLSAFPVIPEVAGMPAAGAAQGE